MRRQRDKVRERGGDAGTGRRIITFFSVIIWTLMLTWGAGAATPFAEYLSRIERAAKIISTLVEGQIEEPDRQRALDAVRQMLPATENIQFGQQVVHVDNAWLHETLNGLNPQEGVRKAQLTELAGRLSALASRLRTAREAEAGEAAAERARLERILARPEYQPESQPESAIEKWVTKVREALFRLLARLLSAGEMPGRAPSAATLNWLRLLIYAGLVLVTVLGLAALARRWLRRAKGEEPGEAREVLGEVIEEDVTAEDLLQRAAELARAGDYRMAIRRAYIALLYELEMRGKLRLHRAKTNRDYLRALSEDQTIYRPAAYLTGAYERVWYGQARATAEDFAGFIQRYREIVSVG
jgi:hypothetical protein